MDTITKEWLDIKEKAKTIYLSENIPPAKSVLELMQMLSLARAKSYERVIMNKPISEKLYKKASPLFEITAVLNDMILNQDITIEAWRKIRNVARNRF